MLVIILASYHGLLVWETQGRGLSETG